jgi:glutamyl-tRNA synthetase
MKLRFAPSPTGYLHLGNTRTALVNWLFARRYGGEFILRMDDTDLDRSKSEFESQILEDLAWLGLKHDHFHKQSDRLDLYTKATQKLKDEGRLYACYETPEELDLQRKVQASSGRPPRYNRAGLNLTEEQKAKFAKEGLEPHWRFLLKSEDVVWNDLVRGEVVIHAEEMSDPVLIRADGSPVYTLASCVDDLEMGVTHVLRGEDHVANTAVQIQLMEALSGKPCEIQFGHTALITGAQGEGLSKRVGSLSLKELRTEGVEALAICCLLAKLGTSQSIVPHVTMQALVDEFDINTFGRSAPKLSTDELWQLNGKILQLMTYDQVMPRLEEAGISEVSSELWSVISGNIERMDEVQDWWKVLYGDEIYPTEETEFIGGAEAVLPEEPWDETTCKAWVEAIKLETGRKGKELFMPLREALTGRIHGPELKDLILFMGREKVLERLRNARGENDESDTL